MWKKLSFLNLTQNQLTGEVPKLGSKGLQFLYLKENDFQTIFVPEGFLNQILSIHRRKTSFSTIQDLLGTLFLLVEQFSDQVGGVSTHVPTSTDNAKFN